MDNQHIFLIRWAARKYENIIKVWCFFHNSEGGLVTGKWVISLVPAEALCWESNYYCNNKWDLPADNHSWWKFTGIFPKNSGIQVKFS